MIKNVLTSMGQSGAYGILALAIFFGFFAGMLIWAFRLKKPYLNSMGDLPVDSHEDLNEERNGQ